MAGENLRDHMLAHGLRSSRTRGEEYSATILHKQVLATGPSISRGEIKSLFLRVLAEMNIQINGLTVKLKRAEAGNPPAGVMFRENKQVELSYDDQYMVKLSDHERKATLCHEACHIAVLPHTFYNVFPGHVDSLQTQVNLIDIFDEFTAHQEFVKRFGDTEMVDAYTRVKVRDFVSYKTILERVRGNNMDATHGVLLILNDAVFFMVAEKNDFQKWCIDNNAGSIHQFCLWVVEDLQHVKDLGLDRRETMQNVVRVGGLWLCVDTSALLKLDTIIFGPQSEEVERLMAGFDRHLSDVWRKRRLTLKTKDS